MSIIVNTSITSESALEILLKNFEVLYEGSERYIFRGQPNCEFKLQPSFFRLDKCKELSDASFLQDLKAWQSSQEIQPIVSICGKGMSPSFLTKFYELAAYILQYNYAIAKHVQKAPSFFDLETQKMYEKRPPSFWIQEETFMRLVGDGLHQASGVISLQGELIKASTIYEDIAAYDESLPQHYGVSTTALDWTYNPYVAVYFSLPQDTVDINCISLYQCKSIANPIRKPFLQCEGRSDVKNIRIIQQEGLFIKIRGVLGWGRVHFVVAS
jgi:hypothetical protein